MVDLNIVEARKKIAENTFTDISDFYNYNEILFKNFERNLGVDIWFLNHFRTYIKYRNYQYSSTEKNDNGSKKVVHTVLSLLRLVSEITSMIIRYNHPSFETVKCLIISNSGDIRNGKNFRFNGLPYETFYNRTLFNVKEPFEFHKISSKKNKQNSDNIFVYSLLRIKFFGNLYYFHRKLKKMRRDMTIQIRGINKNYNTINSIFWSDRIFYYIAYLRYQSFLLFFRKTDINVILMTDENSPQQKVIQYAAAKCGIQIIALQHGNIFSLHPAYMYGAYRVKPLLPTKTITWGYYFSNLLLTKGGYLSTQVETLGRLPLPRSERAVHPRLAKGKKMLLYVSQPQRDSNIRKLLLQDIIITAQELRSEYSLVIRPHPAENNDRFFVEIGKELGYENLFIDRVTDLESHMEMCDVLLVAFSTVGTEFVKYMKPMLVLDYYNQDLMNWIKEGVGIQVKSREDLISILSVSELEIDINAHNSFLKNYLISGKKVIDDMERYIEELIGDLD